MPATPAPDRGVTAAQAPDRGAANATSPEREAQLEVLHATTFLLMRQHRTDLRRAIEPLGLQPPLAFMLLMIAKEALHHPKELAELLDVPPSMVSVMLRELERRGLLDRSIDPADRRRVLLSISAAGQAMLDQLGAAWTDVTRDRVARLDDEELATLIRIQRVLLEPLP